LFLGLPLAPFVFLITATVSGTRPAVMFAGDIDLAEDFVFLFILIILKV
jgi:hypothetical protein